MSVSPSDSFKVSTFKSKTDHRPNILDMSWEILIYQLSQYDFRQDKDGPLFSPAEYEPGTTRAIANVLRVHFLGLDFDDISDDDFAAVATRLAGIRCFTYATWSQSQSQVKGLNCYRVIVALSRPVPAREWPRFFERVTAKFGGKHDKSCKDAARMYYRPSMPIGSERFAHYVSQEGEPLDVDSILALPSIDSKEVSRDRKEGYTITDEIRESHVEKAQRQLVKAEKTIKAIREGEPRHPVLNKLAYALGRLCPHFLDPSTVYERLFAASQQMEDALPPERADDEIRRAIDDGMKHPDNPTEGWEGLLVRTGKELVLAPTATNLTTIFLHDPKWAGVFGYDERSCKTVWLREPPLQADISLGETTPALSVWGDGAPYPRYLQETDVQSVQMTVDRDHRMSFQRLAVGEAIDRASREKTFDPVHQYLERLEWDGISRVDTWPMTYLGVENDVEGLNSEIGAIWLIQAVKRVYEPGCQADYVLVLEGAQGTKKTTAIRILGGQWFTDSVGDTKNKDTYVNLLGKWIVELAELDSMKKTESTSFKAFVSNRDDNFREPYARLATSHPRRCVFAGSTNEDNYLQDPTGARRFLPLAVHKADAEALSRDRDQLWAEAVVMMKAGRVAYIEDERLQARMLEVQDSRFLADDWEDLIASYISDNQFYFILATDVCTKILKQDENKWGRREQMRVASCFKRLGWKRGRVTTVDETGQRPRGYSPDPEKAKVMPRVVPLSAQVLAQRESARGKAGIATFAPGGNVIPIFGRTDEPKKA